MAVMNWNIARRANAVCSHVVTNLFCRYHAMHDIGKTSSYKFMHTLPALPALPAYKFIQVHAYITSRGEFSSIIIIIISSSSSSSSHAYTTGIRSATAVFVASSVLASDIRPLSGLGSHHDYYQHNQKNKQHHLLLDPILILRLIVIIVNFGTPSLLSD